MPLQQNLIYDDEHRYMAMMLVIGFPGWETHSIATSYEYDNGGYEWQ